MMDSIPSNFLLPLTTLTLGVALTTGCVVHDYGNDDVVVYEDNYAPFVRWADAGCYFDSYYYDDVWYFEADVTDGNGALDVVSVWADVYDERTGGLVDSFELYPTNDPAIWFSDWMGSSTYMSCYYPDYTVDFVAYDALDAFDVLTVWADTY